MGAIHATFLADSYTAAAELVSAITQAAERMQHHPDIDVRYPGRVHVALTTHSAGGLTDSDVELAREASALAAAAGAGPEPHAAQIVEFAIDTLDADRIRPFWKAVLGYDDAGGALVDPATHGSADVVPADGRAAHRAQSLPRRRHRSRTTSPSSASTPRWLPVARS